MDKLRHEMFINNGFLLEDKLNHGFFLEAEKQQRVFLADLIIKVLPDHQGELMVMAYIKGTDIQLFVGSLVYLESMDIETIARESLEALGHLYSVWLGKQAGKHARCCA